VLANDGDDGDRPVERVTAQTDRAETSPMRRSRQHARDPFRELWIALDRAEREASRARDDSDSTRLAIALSKKHRLERALDALRDQKWRARRTEEADE
jgi:hypothetical protein